MRGRWLQVWDAAPWLRRLMSDLGRIELIDRSTALGAQALLALIPMLMSLGVLAPAAWGSGFLDQLGDAIGVREDALQPLKDAVMSHRLAQTETGYISLVVAMLSASSFSRAMQRMYARAWDLSKRTGLRAVGISILCLVGWVAMLQTAAALLRALTGIPMTGFVQLTILTVTTISLWWWTAHMLLDGLVSWRRLLPGAALTGISVVALTQLSRLFMPAFTRANLEQFGPLGVVFSIGSWLVMLGGVLVVTTVLGRLVSDLWQPDQA